MAENIKKYVENFSYLNESYRLVNLDEVPESLINSHLSDNEIDKAIKTFDRVVKYLGVKKYSDVYLVETDSEYDIPTYEDQPIEVELLTSTKKLKVYYLKLKEKQISFLVVREECKGAINLYFNNEDYAKQYIDTLDNFYQI